MNEENRETELQALKDSITRAHGRGSVTQLSEIPPFDENKIYHSGSISIDIALGIGGYPKGRIIEIYGPESSGKTTLTLHAIAEVQKKGGTCAFIDTEHALDPIYATNLGVQIENVLLSQPNYGEQALDITEMMARSGVVNLIVIDSVAALTPKSEIEGEMGDHAVGAQARLMSKAMRKLVAVANESKCIIMFTNQIRMKIGVMFGCFHYDTLINFTDGRSIPIGKVVDEKIEGNIYCINEETKQIEQKPIIDWHDNGKVETKEDFIHIQTESINGKGRFGFTCTPDHEILTSTSWRKAKDLSYDNLLVSKYKNTINGTYGDFVRGILIGDSHISARDKNTASLRLQDNQNQEYINWKIDKLSPFLNFTERQIKTGYRYDSDYSYEWKRIKQFVPDRTPLLMLNNYTNMGLALWVMDDGCLDLNNNHLRYSISVKRFKNNWAKLQEIKNALEEVGLEAKINIENGNIYFNKQISLEIAKRIHKYIPECMQYKLPEKYRNKYEDFVLENSNFWETEPVKIKEIRFASDRQMRNKRKFDISIEGNHNYMVGGKDNGIIVHNSPETTTGGNALKFYASQRIEIRRGNKIEQGSGTNKEQIGNITKVKVVKNKVAPPFKTAEFNIIYGKGVDLYGEILSFAVEDGLINKSGSWYKLADEEGTRLGQGELQAIAWLKEHNEEAENMKQEILAARGLL